MPLPRFIETSFFGLPLWFKTIYTCANEELSENTMDAFSSFGNDARKFFEFETAFKYPNKKFYDGMREFWGDDNSIPHLLVTKLNNEFSHVMNTPFEYDLEAQSLEIQTTAVLILKRLKQVDEVQYNSLAESIKTTGMT